MVFNLSTYKSIKKQLMPELLEQDLHPTFSTSNKFSQTDYERQSSGTHIHPQNIFLHDQISFADHRDPGVKAIYTDGSKTNGGTSSSFCILENYGIMASLQDKLNPNNSVFQAKILAIKMVIEAASSLQRPIKIWTNSLYSLMVIINLKSNHSMVRDIQTLLLSQIHSNTFT
ncbi:hypothetical protein AVEN_214386-1 [Araneus ventricosus]|uniref:RNase H type-1 domain-containing protein n=1 Tax=Araneus ventricosus TaxID=182803 RepID=A0A4Y2HNV9_ARAVE|nr:hypothetical protein AVEN_214386-1 [Araneus ventricosus]